MHHWQSLATYQGPRGGIRTRLRCRWCQEVRDSGSRARSTICWGHRTWSPAEEAAWAAWLRRTERDRADRAAWQAILAAEAARELAGGVWSI